MSGETSIFARIVAGDIPCHKVFENEHVFAFLDINPLAVGHTLLIPKQVVPRLEDLTPEIAAELGKQLPILTKKVLAATGAEACNVLLNNGPLAGQEVPHVHFHIVPRQDGDGLGYRWKPRQADAGDLKALAERIIATS